uniref:Uncharacterized protein n=1 Tax=Rhizophora mucronata TaxID=61149 RepID=A0A2P2NIM0_RHIMU
MQRAENLDLRYYNIKFGKLWN